MASNVQQGTRGLSAGDITRLKRLRGARTFKTDTTTNPAPRTEVETGRRVHTEVGGSKIRRPASNWTDYVASQTADFVLETPSGSCGAGKALTINKLCSCDISSAIKHNGLCRSCTHDRIVNRNTPTDSAVVVPPGDCPDGTIRVLGICVSNQVEYFPLKIGSFICSDPISVYAADYVIENSSGTTQFEIVDDIALTLPTILGQVTIPSGTNTVLMPFDGYLRCSL